MKFVAVSDVHIKEKEDGAYLNFLSFLQHPLTKKADAIFLLGDIFDLLVGAHHEYYLKFEDLFCEITSLAKKGKKIYQLEGNHDFHFGQLIEEIKEDNDLGERSWNYLREPLVIRDGKKRIMLAHGDEIEIENPSYQRYRKLIRSRFVYLLANTLVPFRFIDMIGRSASAKSRQLNRDRYEEGNNERVRERFRRMFRYQQEVSNIDSLVCGHSHCRDHYEWNGGFYINNGYFPETKTFTSYDNGHFTQVAM